MAKTAVKCAALFRLMRQPQSDIARTPTTAKTFSLPILDSHQFSLYLSISKRDGCEREVRSGKNACSPEILSPTNHDTQQNKCWSTETETMAEMVGIPQIAKRLQRDGGTIRRLIARVGDELDIKLHRGKGNRLLLSRQDADRLIASYESRRGPVEASMEDASKYDRFGFFYLIQLVPEALPNRVKMGFADDVDKRLAEHRTAAPTAKVLKAWPCKRSWDYAAMDSVSRKACTLVLNEVYEGDIDGFIARGDAFFAVMPSPDAEKELSEHSPLYEADEQDEEKAEGPTS